MSEIPFHIKVLVMLGVAKVKPVDTLLSKETIQEKTHTSKGKKTIKIKPITIFALIPIFIVVLIPAMILLNNDTPLQFVPETAPVSLEPSNGKFTDAQIIAKYPSLVDLDRALNSGELKLDQVSDAMRGMIKQQKLGEFRTP